MGLSNVMQRIGSMDLDLRLFLEDEIEQFIGVVFEFVAPGDVGEQHGPEKFDALRRQAAG